VEKLGGALEGRHLWLIFQASSWCSWYRGTLVSLTDCRWWFDSPLVRVRLKIVDPQKGNGLGQTKTCFFFLWYGRWRSKARSLHENKLLSRRLQHGHRWSHANWQIINTKTQTSQPKGKTQIPQPDLRLTIPRTAKQTAKGARAQQKQPQKRSAKDTVVKTHCVATDSKTCSKRISCHPMKWDTRSALLPRKQQWVAFAIHYRLTQPLRVLSQVLVHVPMYKSRAGTIKRQL